MIFPDLVLTSTDRGHKLMGTVEVETAESVNHLEAMAQWAHLGRARAPFHLYVPAGSVDIARRLAAENQVNVAEIWSYHTDRRPDAVHDGAPRRLRSASRVAPPRRNRRAPPPRSRAAAPPRRETGGAKGFVFVPVEANRTENSHPNSEEEVVLPHLRFSRDKRGYENTFVVHTHGSTGRRRGKPRSRMLYWFRTPPGVRVGRSALDEDAIRLIEQHNPHIDFDWTRILKSQDRRRTRATPTGGTTRPRPRDRDPRPREVHPGSTPPE